MEQNIENITRLIFEKIGVVTKGALKPAGPRQGLSFWFENYTRGEGPIFSIRPGGLKRHIVSVEFGPYASPCIDHIKARTNDEAYSIAHAFVAQLAEHYDVEIDGVPTTNDWTVQTDMTIQVTRNVEDQKEILESIELIMIPLIAAMAELIGYEEDEQPIAEEIVEGEMSTLLINRRERSSRNRLLCLAIHGQRCSVCGNDPDTTYSALNRSILEVHHIEPLSIAESPRAYNPKTDLIPLCPNCHRAIHKRIPPYTPEELRRLLNL